MGWTEDQAWESAWWNSCANTYGEETKQITYAHRMGLVIVPNEKGQWPVYDVAGKTILDLGGGPVSMLLKTMNARHPTVVDPGDFPQWVTERYKTAGIEYIRQKGETYLGPVFDEVWMYNVLQHVDDPELVLSTAKHSGKMARIFEWIDTVPVLPGHPHSFTEQFFTEHLGQGATEYMNENGCYGRAFYGAFVLA